MVRVRSITICVSMAEGMEAFSAGIAARMRSTVSMMLAPGWRKIMMRTEGLPLTKPAARMFSVESWTFATSDNLTAAPLW